MRGIYAWGGAWDQRSHSVRNQPTNQPRPYRKPVFGHPSISEIQTSRPPARPPDFRKILFFFEIWPEKYFFDRFSIGPPEKNRFFILTACSLK